jgi:hypothetical protein
MTFFERVKKQQAAKRKRKDDVNKIARRKKKKQKRKDQVPQAKKKQHVAFNDLGEKKLFEKELKKKLKFCIEKTAKKRQRSPSPARKRTTRRKTSIFPYWI